MRWSWRSVAGTPRCRRYAFAHGIGEAIEIASELWFCINETTSDDLAN